MTNYFVLMFIKVSNHISLMPWILIPGL